MNNVEAYNTNIGNGSPFETLESFQVNTQTATQPATQPAMNTATDPAANTTSMGVAPTCQNGTVVGDDGLCPGSGEAPQCAEGTTLDTASGMCMEDASNAVPAVSCPEGQEPNESGVCAPVVGNPAVAQQTQATAPTTPDTVATPTAATPQCKEPGHVWNPQTQTCGPVEGFFGGNSMDMDLLLKALVFGCLFFILAHNDTRKMLTNASFLKSLKLKAGDDNSLLILMGVFVICYIVLVRYVL